MAQFGPFCRRDSWLVVRGVWERFITHLSMWFLHVCGLLMLLLVVFPWVGRVAIALVEGVGAMDVAGTLELVEEVEDLGEILDGTFGCPLKLLELRSMWSKWWLWLVRLWWHPYLLKYSHLNLSCCFVFILSCRCSLILLMNNLALSKTWSSDGSETEIWAVLVVWLERLSLNLLYCSALCLSNIARIPLIFLIHSYRSSFSALWMIW